MSDVAIPVACDLESSATVGWAWDEQVYERVLVRTEVPAPLEKGLSPTHPAVDRPVVRRRDESAKSLQLIAWVHDIRMGSVASLSALHNACGRRVYAQALRVVQRPCVAEEVAADCFWQVWREASSFDAARGPVLSWLAAITRARAIDTLRRLAAVSKHELPMDRDEDLALAHGSTAAEPAHLFERSQRSLYASQLLESLVPVQRQLLSLAYFDGLSHREIARHCGMPLGTVKSHIKRALARLHGKCAGERLF